MCENLHKAWPKSLSTGIFAYPALLFKYSLVSLYSVIYAVMVEGAKKKY